MSETDVVEVGEQMPALAGVRPVGPTSIVVEWSQGSRTGRREVVDLAPVLLTLKAYRPLRENAALFQTVRAIRGGSAIGWSEDAHMDDDEITIDMSADTVERLAEETMTSADFKAWLDRHRLTFDAAAAELGISRRLAAYYASGRQVPRYIWLACACLDQRLASGRAATGQSGSQPSQAGRRSRPISSS